MSPVDYGSHTDDSDLWFVVFVARWCPVVGVWGVEAVDSVGTGDDDSAVVVDVSSKGDEAPCDVVYYPSC